MEAPRARAGLALAAPRGAAVLDVDVVDAERPRAGLALGLFEDAPLRVEAVDRPRAGLALDPRGGDDDPMLPAPFFCSGAESGEEPPLTAFTVGRLIEGPAGDSLLLGGGGGSAVDDPGLGSPLF